MNRVEQAIQIIRNNIPIAGDSALIEAFDLGIVALREKAERDRGCTYCKPSNFSEVECYIPLENGTYLDVPYIVCSNCGRPMDKQEGDK